MVCVPCGLLVFGAGGSAITGATKKQLRVLMACLTLLFLVIYVDMRYISCTACKN